MRGYRWGVLGEGPDLLGVIRALQSTPGVICQALATRTPIVSGHDKAAFARCYSEYEDLLLDKQVDAVYVLGAVEKRAAWIRACIAYQKNIIIGAWPLSLSEQDMHELFDQAQTKNVVLMEGLVMSYYPTMKRIKKLIDENKIGRLWGLQADASLHLGYSPQHDFYSQEKHTGGLFMHHGRYPICLASTLLGIPKGVKGNALRAPNGLCEQYHLWLDYGSKASAYLTASARAYGSENAYLYGTKSRIHIDAPFYHETLFTLYTERRRTGLIKLPSPPPGAPFRYVIEEAHRCLEDHRNDSPLRTPKDIRNTLKTLKMCQEQATYYQEKGR